MHVKSAICSLLFIGFITVLSAQKPATKQPVKPTVKPGVTKPAPVKPAVKPGVTKPAPAQPKVTTTPAVKPPLPIKQQGINLEKFSMDFSPTVIFPIFSLGLSTKISPGVQLGLWYKFNNRSRLAFTTGFFEMMRKKTEMKAGHVIPFLLVYRHCFTQKIHAEIGAGMIRDQGTSAGNAFFTGGNFVIKRFAYRGGLGMQLNPTWDLNLRFEGATINSWVALFISYTFNNQNVNRHEK